MIPSLLLFKIASAKLSFPVTSSNASKLTTATFFSEMLESFSQFASRDIETASDVSFTVFDKSSTLS